MADSDNLHDPLEVILSAIKAYAAARQFYTAPDVGTKIAKNGILNGVCLATALTICLGPPRPGIYGDPVPDAAIISLWS